MKCQLPLGPWESLDVGGFRANPMVQGKQYFNLFEEFGKRKYQNLKRHGSHK